ncbi:MAG: minor capsid protein, partial [Campylobacterales bacterium]|nr:minor capsid protein [Campylobacterales bacterium]
EKKIANNFHLINAWSRAKTNESLDKIYTRLNTPQHLRSNGVDRFLPTVETVKLQDVISDQFINSTVKQNLALIKTLKDQTFDKVANSLENSLLNGESYKTIAENIEHVTGVHRSKAKFWARDQASKFFGKTTEMRQLDAGIPGYIWRTIGDGGVRDSHSALEGTYHTWDQKPKVYRAGKHGGGIVSVHPGEDFNCRCWAEPALGKDDADREYIDPSSYQEQLDRNYFDKRAGEANNRIIGKGIKGNSIVDVQGSIFKNEIEDSISSMDRIFNIDLSKHKTMTISEIVRGEPYFQTNTAGYFYPRTGHIAVKYNVTFRRTTVIHEIAHWLDFNIVSQKASKEFQKFIKIANESDALKNIIETYPINTVKYLLDNQEIFARAFEQYVSMKSDDNRLIDSFESKKNKYKNRYWVDKDFKKIYIQLESIFKKLGWL